MGERDTEPWNVLTVGIRQAPQEETGHVKTLDTEVLPSTEVRRKVVAALSRIKAGG